tara:strand:+ start:838 stop:1191 length:354 start_codon:yes stop_codon:yes gene_type:complete
MDEKKKFEVREILIKMFDVKHENIVFMSSRKKKNIEARKFYNYYLYKYKGITHNQMKKHIYGMHHATSIYFKNKIEFEFKIYPEILNDWNTFLFFADHEVWSEQETIKKFREEYINN